jgi:hypothetical protein
MFLSLKVAVTDMCCTVKVALTGAYYDRRGILIIVNALLAIAGYVPQSQPPFPQSFSLIVIDDGRRSHS